MEVELALEIVKELLAPKYLNPPQEMVFRAVWEGNSYRDVAETVGYDCDYIRGVGAQIWRMLATATEKRVSKNNFRQLLESLVSNRDRAVPQDRQLTQSQIDWGETVDVSVFYGREREYARLYQWLTTDRCRLVTILGMGGMGKTTIASELARELKSTADKVAQTGAEVNIDGFSHVLWRSLFNAQPLIALLPELIREIIGTLPTQSISSKFRGNLSKKTVPDLIELLLDICQQYRCAIVLDNAESIFQSGSRVGQYRAGYADYGELFMTMGRMTHQSCLLLTSREKPIEIGQLEGINTKVRTLALPGLDPISGQRIFADRGCSPVSAAEWTEIDKYYGGNPLAFQLIAAAVKEVADGDVSAIFPHLRSHKLSFADIQILLCQQWDRLTPAEQQVMYWLAIDREPMSLVDLEAALHPIWNHQVQSVPHLGATSLLTILQFLRRRSILLTLSSQLQGGGRYWSLQPMIMEYVTGRFVEQICTEIAANKPFLLDTHSIVQANAKEYIRQAQLQTIVQPAIDLLRISIGNSHQIGLQLRQILTEWRSVKPLATGYLAGNILNFLAYLKLDLTDLDCSELVIRQAYLAEIDLRQIDLTNAQIVDCAFTQTFSAILSIAYSPDGSVLAASDTNGEIHLWRVSDGQCSLVCSGHTNWVRAIKFSPDGRYLASSSDDRSIKLWDCQDGTCLRTIGEGIHSMGVCFSPDGRYLASGSDNNAIYYWDLQTGICVRQFAGHQGWSIAVDIHPQGHQLVSGSADGSVRLWDLDTDRCERVWQDHENWVTTVNYSPDGKTILSGSLDGTLRLWDVSSGKCLRVSTEHGGEIWSAAFSPDGTCFASAGVDGLLWIWRTTDGHCLHRLEGHSKRLWSVAFQPDGLRLASGGENRAIRFWQVSDGKCLQVINGYSNWFKSIDWSPDSQTLITASRDAQIRVWDLQSQSCLHEFIGHTKSIFAVAHDPHGRTFASSSNDRTLKIWDARTHACLQTLHGHTDGVCTIAYSPDGKSIVSGGNDRTIRSWDIMRGRCLQVWHGHTDRVSGLVYHPDGRLFASASEDATVRIWSLQDDLPVQILTQHTNRAISVAFDPLGGILASGGMDSQILLWDVRTGELLHTLTGHPGWILALAYSPDGRWLFSGASDYTIRVWSMETGTCIDTLIGHQSWVWSISVSYCGRFLASASEDETIRIWDIPTGELLSTRRARRPYEGMNISGIEGLTKAQIEGLKALGARD